MEHVDIYFCSHFAYFMAIWYIFNVIWYVVSRIIWQPWFGNQFINKEPASDLLVKERPEDGHGQEDVDDALQRLHVLDEGIAVLVLGVVQHRVELLRLAMLPPLAECVLKES
jgi:hypothetical protein